MAWLKRVRRGLGNNCLEVQMPGPLEFEMQGDKLIMKSTIDDDDKEHVFMLWGTETEDLRRFLLEK